MCNVTGSASKRDRCRRNLVDGIVASSLSRMKRGLCQRDAKNCLGEAVIIGRVYGTIAYS